ncbi:MAG: sulfite exporter TauE/SafE family protein [Acidimicrobiales bacterium]
MHVDLTIALAGLLVGFTVGLTGMGGGALMTPILILVFKVDPLTAVSSDLVASFVMKPVGAGVHLRRGTVDLRLVRWLVLGSVPSAFAGVLLLRAFGDGTHLQDTLKVFLGAALLLAASTILVKAVLGRRRGPSTAPGVATDIVVRPLATVAVGVVGGLVVGMTSVGSGSLMIVALLLLYPSLRASQLVGTDLVQAIPLVGAASLGHLLFGDFELGLTTSLLIGALPGVYIGARLSSRAPDHVIKPVLVVVLAASALKLLGVGTTQVGIAVAAGIVVALAARATLGRTDRSNPAPAPAAAERPRPSA